MTDGGILSLHTGGTQVGAFPEITKDCVVTALNDYRFMYVIC